jgi:uncharacterized protein (DUF433 family)
MTFDRVAIDPEVCAGKPCIRGMRLPVHQVVELVAAGNGFEAILEEHPFLENEDIRQALAYAAWLAQDEWIAV